MKSEDRWIKNGTVLNFETVSRGGETGRIRMDSVTSPPGYVQHNSEQNLSKIDLNTPLDLRSSFTFPLQSNLSRREIALGAIWLLVPFIGWLLNMGHRIVVVHNMMQGRPPWPGWNNYPSLLFHGFITFSGMLFYYSPTFLLVVAYFWTGHSSCLIIAGICFTVATLAIPGYMSHYCVSFDTRQIFNPRRAILHVVQARTAYWHAWLIALLALVCSFAGLLLLGVGFLFTSVWFWQVAGFSFATVMTQQHALNESST